MISIICNNSLNRCVSDYSISKLGEILDKTRELIVDEFKLSEEEVLDGMDISICSIEGQQFSYAGANNPLWLIRNRNEECRTDSSNESLVLNMENREYQLFEVKADKQPVGRYDVMKPFVTHEIQVNKGDVIYLFSDGFVDQFGGDNDKKYKAKRFKDLLLSIQDNDMKQQKELITSAFCNWKGDNEQTDDICVLGLTI
jgi:serine phosphatase RsbU (regulator of sigma subunit)